MDKTSLKELFQKKWKDYYYIEALVRRGFERRACKHCGKHFWTVVERELCGDSSCVGYGFIGDPPTEKRLGYLQSWEVFKDYFKRKNHTVIEPYPTVARWRDDLYFTNASISDFQPYVVRGEIEPPANPLIIPQPCIRFSDVSNVGVTGRHYTNFVMLGQHAFNSEKSGVFYWKEEAIDHDVECLKEFGIALEEITFTEDVWVGGGNAGACMEYFVRGLEVGNCVFMQYETNDALHELKIKVIDMGAGLDRFAWITNGTPTSYDVRFDYVIEKMKERFGVSVDEKLFLEYAKMSGKLNIDEVDDLKKARKDIAKRLGMEEKQLYGMLAPMEALYVCADHLLTLLFTVCDGMLPSNAGGGYNLRMLARRMFGIEEEFSFQLEFGELLELHAKNLKTLFPKLEEARGPTEEVLLEEKKKYIKTKERAKGKVISLIKSKSTIDEGVLSTLYRSDGIPPEYVQEIGQQMGAEVSIPPDFYTKILGEERIEQQKQKVKNINTFQKTKQLYYTTTSEFEAEVIGIVGDYIVLDSTAFYPESGGQRFDRGEINEERVLEVINEDGVILHKVKHAEKFRLGEIVVGKVDIRRRKNISAHHTAAHLLNAAARCVLGKHVWQAGSFKDEDIAHLDITHFRKISDDELNEIERKVNEYITMNIPIEIEVLARNVAEKLYGFRIYQGGAVLGKEIRIVKIGSIDAEACGGTHQMLYSTAEIGMFKVVRREGIQDGVERVVFKVGDAAVQYIQQKEKLLKEACVVLDVGEKELPVSVEKFFEEWKTLRKKKDKLMELLAKREIEFIDEKRPLIKVMDVDDEFGKAVATQVSELEKGAIGIITQSKNVFVGCGKSSLLSAREILSAILRKFGGKGGGNKEFAAGKIEKIPEKKTIEYSSLLK